MSQTIKTYNDLCAEKERMQNLLVVQRQRVVDDWTGVKVEFQPVGNAFGVVKKMFSPHKTNPLVDTTLKMVTDVFIKSFVLGKAGWITRLAVPFVMKNYSSHLIADKGRTIVSRISNILARRRARRTTGSSDQMAPLENPYTTQSNL